MAGIVVLTTMLSTEQHISSCNDTSGSNAKSAMDKPSIPAREPRRETSKAKPKRQSRARFQSELTFTVHRVVTDAAQTLQGNL
jgi:hypothetical protein